jgi:aconitate hydratase
VRAVIAESYERIHRSNLVGMGVLPFQFKDGDTAESLGLDGTEHFDIPASNDLKPRQEVDVVARGESGEKRFSVVLRADTPVEIDYLRNGGILHTVLRRMAAE